MDTASGMRLIGARRFGPFFLAQFLGALNDNLFKGAVVIQFAFAGGGAALVNAAAGLFVLPFFLFSATAGQLADRLPKPALIRRLKAAEVAVMGFGAAALATGSIPGLLAALFLMGAQSAFFGPAKYALLPQALREGELVAGNGLVEMGTFVAILAGTLLGGLLAAHPDGPLLAGAVALTVALAGWIASRSIPDAPAEDPGAVVGWNPLTQTARVVGEAVRAPRLLRPMLAISWFWLVGAVYLTQLPAFARDVLGGDEAVSTVLLAAFAVGVGAGSALCPRLVRGRNGAGAVLLGAVGVAAFGLDLALAADGAWRAAADLAALGFSGGLFVVPLYARLQERAEPERRARAMAANNVLNAGFMVAAAVAAAVAIDGLGVSVRGFLLLTAGASAAAALGLAARTPGILPLLLTRALYRVRLSGVENLPARGPALIVCNHVSYLDALVILAACRRPVRFVMDHRIFATPGLNLLFRAAGGIPIAPRREDPAVHEAAFARIADRLRRGEVVCIFPEGRLTRDGAMGPFRPGVARILRETPVPVVPMALRGLWGTFFSRSGRGAFRKLPLRLWSRVELVVGRLIPPEQAALPVLEDAVAGLRGPIP